jgi:hypothetical protein
VVLRELCLLASGHLDSRPLLSVLLAGDARLSEKLSKQDFLVYDGHLWQQWEIKDFDKLVSTTPVPVPAAHFLFIYWHSLWLGPSRANIVWYEASLSTKVVSERYQAAIEGAAAAVTKAVTKYLVQK